MKQITIASGKGGTGKTTIAVNLAVAADREKLNVALLDCDVEEPNAGLFLTPSINETHPVMTSHPVVDLHRCSGCGLCSEICQYGAITVISGRPIVFPGLCHGCGGCSLVCPREAISEKERPIGIVESGRARGMSFVQGRLDIGEIMAPKVIENVKLSSPSAGLVIIDAPPGTTCPVVETVRGSDYVVVVAEDSVFGLNDLKLMVEMLNLLHIRFGVVINRAVNERSPLREYLAKENIDVFVEIPESRALAESYSKGELLYETGVGYQDYMHKLLAKLMTLPELCTGARAR